MAKILDKAGTIAKEVGLDVLQESLPGPLKSGMQSKREGGSFTAGAAEYLKETAKDYLKEQFIPPALRKYGTSIGSAYAAAKDAQKVSENEPQGTKEPSGGVDKNLATKLTNKIDGIAVQVNRINSDISYLKTTVMIHDFKLRKLEAMIDDLKQGGYKVDNQKKDDGLSLLDLLDLKGLGGAKGTPKGGRAKGLKGIKEGAKAGAKAGAKLGFGIAAIIAVYEAWTQISALNPNLPYDQYKKEVTKIILKLLDDVSISVVAGIIGGIVGGAIPVFGSLAGFISGVAAGYVIDYAVGDSYDMLVDSVVDYLWLPEQQNKSAPKAPPKAVNPRGAGSGIKPLPKTQTGSELTQQEALNVIKQFQNKYGRYGDRNEILSFAETLYPGRKYSALTRAIEKLEKEMGIGPQSSLANNKGVQYASLNTGTMSDAMNYKETEQPQSIVQKQSVLPDAEERKEAQSYKIITQAMLTLEAKNNINIDSKGNLKLKAIKELEIDAPVIKFTQQGIILTATKGMSKEAAQAEQEKAQAALPSAPGGDRWSKPGEGGPSFPTGSTFSESFGGGSVSAGGGGYTGGGGDAVPAAPAPVKALTAEQKAVFDQLKTGQISIDDPKAAFLKGKTPEQLAQMGVQQTTKDGKTFYSQAAVSDQQAIESLKSKEATKGKGAKEGTGNLKGQAARQKQVYDAFINAGFSDNQAKALTAEVGRENGYQSKYLFGAHIDPANKAVNTGFFSWQGSRGKELLKRLGEKGLIDKNGKLIQSQETLDEMAKFAKHEMETKPDYADTKKQFLENPDIDPEAASRVLGKNYVRWRIDDPKYAHHKEYRRQYLKDITETVSQEQFKNEIPTGDASSFTPTPQQIAEEKTRIAQQQEQARVDIAGVTQEPNAVAQSRSESTVPTATKDQQASSSGVIAPLSGTFEGTQNSYYGAARGSYSKGGRTQHGPKTRRHSGSDWNAPDGTDVVFPVNGKIVHVGEHSGYGYMVDLMGDDGKVYRMATHASVGKFQVGQQVKQGDFAGKVGEGHLHMEVIPDKINGKPNPVYSEFQQQLESGEGGFVRTSNQRGTVNQAELFGMKMGTKVTQGGVIGGGQPGIMQPASVTTTQPDATPTHKKGETVFFGDSIAQGLKDSAKGEGTTKVGRKPHEVLKVLQDKGADYFKGKTVVLSTGLSNNTNDIASVKKQLEFLKAAGANVQIAGMSFDRKDLSAGNDVLSGLAKEYGYNFMGGFNTNDKIHPKNYDEYLKNVSTSEPQVAGTAQRMPYQTLAEAQENLRKLKPTSSLLPEMKAYGEYGKSRADAAKAELPKSPMAGQGSLSLPMSPMAGQGAPGTKKTPMSPMAGQGEPGPLPTSPMAGQGAAVPRSRLFPDRDPYGRSQKLPGSIDPVTGKTVTPALPYTGSTQEDFRLTAFDSGLGPKKLLTPEEAVAAYNATPLQDRLLNTGASYYARQGLVAPGAVPLPSLPETPIIDAAVKASQPPAVVGTMPGVDVMGNVTGYEPMETITAPEPVQAAPVAKPIPGAGIGPGNMERPGAAAGVGPGNKQVPINEPKAPAPTETPKPKPDGQVAYEGRVKEAEDAVKRAEEREKGKAKGDKTATGEDRTNSHEVGSVSHNPESRRATPGNNGYGNQKQSNQDLVGICSI